MSSGLNDNLSNDLSKRVKLILGGARSGKSRFAEQAAKDSGKDVIYIATATVYDDEMQQRIDRHIDDRPSHWQTIEEPLQLAQVIRQYDKENTCLLVDCLTLWLSNILMTESPSAHTDQVSTSQEAVKSLTAYKAELLQALSESRAEIILVSNEVGQGIVPMGELSRRFVDEAGWLHQDIARIAQQVTLVVAGLPMQLK